MMMDDGPKPKIIVVKKKVHAGHGHHGGSWKVAYADFVTAMMAFFLVMWIMGMDSGVKDMVQGYFSNPIGFQTGFAAGNNPLSTGGGNMELRRAILGTRRDQQERFEGTIRRVTGAIDDANDNRLGSKLEAAVEFVVTEEGLRIELMETGSENIFFGTASADPSEILVEFLDIIAPELSLLPNQVVIEGHTDAVPFRGDRVAYSNWELSTDRAHAARRILEDKGLAAGRIIAVRGFADRRLRNAADPRDPSNRRISILLPFVEVGEFEEERAWSREGGLELQERPEPGGSAPAATPDADVDGSGAGTR
jgi:chemotaxis protein MotB